MNGARSAIGAVSTVGGGRGGGRIAPGTFSSCLPGVKNKHLIMTIKITWYCAKVLVCVGFMANTIPA